MRRDDCALPGEGSPSLTARRRDQSLELGPRVGERVQVLKGQSDDLEAKVCLGMDKPLLLQSGERLPDYADAGVEPGAQLRELQPVTGSAPPRQDVRAQSGMDVVGSGASPRFRGHAGSVDGPNFRKCIDLSNLPEQHERYGSWDTSQEWQCASGISPDGSSSSAHRVRSMSSTPARADSDRIHRRSTTVGTSSGSGQRTCRPSSTTAYNPADLGAPAPRPRQLLAIGLNYRDHVAESGFGLPDQPPVFTKFMSAITGPFGDVAIPAGNVDWEVELVVVMGKGARDINETLAWDHIAGVTVGQDISERITQSAGPAPQFSLGKSFASFAPMGPWLVTPDELPARDDLALGLQRQR